MTDDHRHLGRGDLESVLRAHPRAEVVEGGGVTLVRVGWRVERVELPGERVRALLRAADGTRDEDGLVAALDPRRSPEARSVVEALLRAGALVARPKPRALVPLRVEVLGGGDLARAIAARLAQAGHQAVARDAALPSADAELVVWAREGCATADALAANDACLRAGAPVLFAVAEGDEVAVGPLVVPGRTACLACALASATDEPAPLEAHAAFAVGTCRAPLAERVADEVARAVADAAAPDDTQPAILRERSRRSGQGSRRNTPAWPRSGCASCASAEVRPTRFDLAASLVLRAARPSIGGGGPRDGGAPRRVGVVGGGTAGYLAALALRRRHPDVAVTLLESSSIPVIGVGEATTPDLVEFLLRDLGVDELELYREVRPTWKLGIRFFWGEPGPSHFHHPFVGEHLLDAHARAGDHDLQSLSAQLMARDLAPVLREPDGRVVPLLGTTPYAYHLDNARFVRFLRDLAARRGVEHVDCVIDDVALAPDGSVAHLRARDGRTFAFDLYVDASGFRSLLLRDKLGVPFEGYDASLFTDTAVVADVPHEGPLAPYTLAETMDAGWCWLIPTPEENHRGYVFASSHLSPDAAEAEMRRKNPRMGDARLVRFRSGRHAECWKHNVFALGNAYAFVEPLESTALHMLVHAIRLLAGALPEDGGAEPIRARVNHDVGAHWDYLRDFLALHYRFNRKLDTPFWRRCREEVALFGGEALFAAYQAGAPLTARPDRAFLEDTLLRDRFFGLLGVDNVLLGQKVPTRLLHPRGDGAAFERWRRHGLPAVLGRALPHREALDAYLGWLQGER